MRYSEAMPGGDDRPAIKNRKAHDHYAQHALHRLAAHTPHAGLLYAPGTDWANWAMIAIVAVAVWCLMPGQLKESAKALWAPVGRFLRSLRAPLAVGWWGWMVLCVLREREMGYFMVIFWLSLALSITFTRAWLLGAGFRGFMVPIVR